MFEKVKANVAKGHYFKYEFQIKNDLSKLRKKVSLCRRSTAKSSALAKRKKSEMSDTERASFLQAKLYQKAKQERDYSTIIAKVNVNASSRDKMLLGR